MTKQMTESPRTALLAFLLSLASFATTTYSCAGVPDPDTTNGSPQDAAHYGEIYIRAINSDEDDERRALVGLAFSNIVEDADRVTKLAAQAKRVRDRVGTLRFHHGEVQSFTEQGKDIHVLHLFAQRLDNDKWIDLQFYVEPVRPWRLASLVFTADVSEPIALPNVDILAAPALDWLDRYVSKLHSDEGLSGALLVAEGERIAYKREFGYKDAGATHPVSGETRFNLASGGKMFTAVLIAKLVSEGKLSWDEPVAEYFPDYPDQAALRKVRLRHLLSHTSGIGEYWTDAYAAQRHTIKEASDLLPWIYRVKVTSEPGSRYEYSNSNYALAGLIAEKVTGIGYRRLVDSRILGPLQMQNSGFPYDAKSADLDASALVRSGKDWAEAPAGGHGTPAGGAVSTTSDMLRFIRGIKSGAILSEKALAEMTHWPSARQNDREAYGLGFQLRRHASGWSFGHGGIAPGINFDLRHYPDRDITIIVFSNQDNGAFDDLRRNVNRLVTGER